MCRRGRANAQSIFGAVYHLRMRVRWRRRRRRRRNSSFLGGQSPFAVNIDRIRAALRSYYFVVPGACPRRPPPTSPSRSPVLGGESLKLGRPTRTGRPSSDGTPYCGGNSHTRRNPVETGRARSSEYFVGLDSTELAVRSSSVVCWGAHVTYGAHRTVFKYDDNIINTWLIFKCTTLPTRLHVIIS